MFAGASPPSKERIPSPKSHPSPAVPLALYPQRPLGESVLCSRRHSLGTVPEPPPAASSVLPCSCGCDDVDKFVSDSSESQSGLCWEGPQRSPHPTPAVGQPCMALARVAPSPIQAGIWLDLLQSRCRSPPWLKPGPGGAGAGAAAGEGRTERGGTGGTVRGERSRALREGEGRSRAERGGKERSRRGRRGKGRGGKGKEGKERERKARRGKGRQGEERGAKGGRQASSRAEPEALPAGSAPLAPQRWGSAAAASPPAPGPWSAEGLRQPEGNLRGARGEAKEKRRRSCGEPPEPPPRPKVSAARLWGRGRRPEPALRRPRALRGL